MVFCLPSSKSWGSYSCTAEQHVVSSFPYCTVMLAQRLITDSHVTGRRSDASLAASSHVTWYLLFLSFSPASVALYRFTQGLGSFSAFSMLRGTQPSCRFRKSSPLNAKHFWSFLISISYLLPRNGSCVFSAEATSAVTAVHFDLLTV